MTDDRPDWALFYKTEVGRPREFCEVRRVDHAVWVRSGNVETWGSLRVTECGGPEQATARFDAACARQAADGWVLTRQGTYDPLHFDFDLVEQEIREGARQAFTAVRAAHPGETINGFALVSDESAMTLGAVTTSEEALCAGGGKDDLRFNPDEWPYMEGGEYLDIAYRLILPRQQELPLEIPFAEFQAGVFEAAIGAMEELDREGLFGAGPVREQLLLLFHVTDAESIEGAAERLNTPSMYARYREWWESWN